MKLHPFTVLYRGLSRGVALGSLGFFVGTSLAGTGALPGPVVGFPLAALGFLTGVGYEMARYQRFEYEIEGNALHIRSGVFSRRRREIPVRRVQNVDVRRSVAQRVLGIATVNVETAGGGQTEASLECVGAEEAARIQTVIRERRAAAKAEERAGEGERAPPAESERESEGEGEPERAREVAGAGSERSVEGERPTAVQSETLFELSNRDLLTLSLLSFDPRALSALIFAVPFVAPTISGVVGGLGTRALVVVGLVLAVVLGLAIWVIGAAATFAQFYGFRLTRLGEDLRYERGLFQRHDGSIPLDKLQALAVEENLLMRRFGYGTLTVETAGYAPGQSPSGGSEAAIPLAPRDRLLELAREIEPFEEPTFDQPPARAKRRYTGRYAIAALVLTGAFGLVDAFVVDLGPWYLVGALALLAPVGARARWRNLGYALGENHAFAREGFWRRRTAIVPYYRVQTVITRRTIFQRRWGLSTLVLDTAGSRRLRGTDARFVDADVEDASVRRKTVRERLVAVLREGS